MEKAGRLLFIIVFTVTFQPVYFIRYVTSTAYHTFYTFKEKATVKNSHAPESQVVYSGAVCINWVNDVVYAV